MPFNLNLADNEDAMIYAKPKPPRPSGSFHEFWKGVSFGLGIVFVMIAVFAVYRHVVSFPDLGALKAYWVAWR